MIVGIGMDAVRIGRMEREGAREDGGFLDAVFTDGERTECGGSARELAIRFAAKEAAAKALRTGIRDEVSWTGIEVLQESREQHRIVWHGGALARARELGVRATRLSCAAGGALAVAWVVLEG